MIPTTTGKRKMCIRDSTEIEPFGGAATCLGGAIRDPLSGRSYVYQAMRVTGAGDPLVPIEEDVYKRQSRWRCTR